MSGSRVPVGGASSWQTSWKWEEALRQRGWMLCSHNKLLCLLRLSVDLVWFAEVGGCLMEIVATPLPTPYPLGGATGRDGVQCDRGLCDS